ncbi:MAG: Aminodeoxychorismate lyase [uncultured bacterium]|nr:MAG: Aminodeoxychorismate lyase [uncultured bacterium]HBD05038.1 endolytic transglycosylase MltG [Candidatus Uhrbacteria bacterium]
MRKAIFFLIIFAIAAYSLYALFLMYLIQPKIDSASQIFTVEQGDVANEIALRLAEQGIIKNKFIFNAFVLISKKQNKLQAGAFELIPGMSYGKILYTLANPISNEKTITILEGWTVREIGEYLEKQGLVDAKEWNALADGSEGYLFPDTYRVFADSTAQDIENKLLAGFDARVDESLRAKILSQGKTLEDIVILASIIEREVRAPEDRKIVSGIFWNRLNLGMALQADSTVNYITGKNDPSITLIDRDIDSPYNTYKYKGLPPGPICNPGLDSILSAIEPAETDYMYFLTDQEGKVYYAKTFDGHILNKQKYLDN